MSIKKDIFYNLIGYTLPFLIGYFTVPSTINAFGIDDFGSLTLLWALIGYSSIFDVAISRTTTNVISEQIGKESKQSMVRYTSASIFFSFFIGIIFSGIIIIVYYAAEKIWFNSVNNLLTALKCYIDIFSFCIPLITLNAAVNGVLSAHRRFDIVNCSRILQGISMFMSPLIVFGSDNKLYWATFLFVFLRSLITLSLIFLLIKFTNFIQLSGFGWVEINKICKTIVGLFISSVQGPLLVYAEKFIIKLFLGSAGLAYFNMPYEIVIRFLVFATSLSSTLFTLFSNNYILNPKKNISYFKNSTAWLSIIMYCLTSLLIIFGSKILIFWLGFDFQISTGKVIEILAIGLYFSALSHIPTTLLQASGRSDLSAKIHLLQIPIYIVIFSIDTSFFGVNGSAITWTIRVFVDLIMQYSGLLIMGIYKGLDWNQYNFMIVDFFFFALLMNDFSYSNKILLLSVSLIIKCLILKRNLYIPS